MIRMFVLAIAMLASGPATAAPSHTTVVYVDHHPSWLDEPVIVVNHVRLGMVYDVAIPSTHDLAPPVDDVSPDVGVDACVAGERPLVIRHFRRGASSYTSSC